MQLNSYPKVYSIGHAAVADLFKEPVLVEEKIDGSQFSFGVHEGELFFRSKGQDVNSGFPGMFAAGVNAVSELKDLLHEGWTYRGEYLMKPKHNALSYLRVPRHNVILFDINTGLEAYLTRGEKEQEAERLGLELVPVLAEGMFTDSETLLKLLEADSILGGTKIEGIAVKNYVRFGRDGKALMGKYVSEAFKERHAKDWKQANPGGKDIVAMLIAELRTEARWEKAVQHLRELGKLAHEPKDIGPLIKEVQKDILVEEAERIAAKLLTWATPLIQRGTIRGLPEWYKTKLLESAFEGSEE